MDNLSAHKVADIESIIEKAGAKVIYLSPYSNDLAFPCFIHRLARDALVGINGLPDGEITGTLVFSFFMDTILER